jgi:hypothetical protein
VTRDDGVIQLHAHAIDSANLPARRTVRGREPRSHAAPRALRRRDLGSGDWRRL